MIFVSVGTHEDPFDRLVAAVESLGADEEVIVQCGPSRVRPPNATCVDYMSFDEVVEHVRRARAVVMHAGVGSTMVALWNDTRPVVMPRRAHLGEHVDDHQVELAARMQESGLVTVAMGPEDLPAAVAACLGRGAALAAGRPALAEDIGGYVRDVVAGARPPRRG